MKSKMIIMVALFLSATAIQAQDKFYTKSGNISFHSKAPLENIDAVHKSVTCVLDSRTGNMQFAVLMKGFEFEKALMQEHFNENYVESHKYPKAEFRGQVVNNGDISYVKDGSYTAKVKGKLTLHGETRDVEATGKLVVKSGRISADAEFRIQLSDYGIEIPKIVKENISNSVLITVDCAMEPLKG